MVTYMHQSFFVLIITLIIGQGDGQRKKPSRDVIEQDLKLYKKISEDIKREFESFYGEYPESPISDYFLEEIDYVQDKLHKLQSNMKRAQRKELYFTRKRIPTQNNHASTEQTLEPNNSELTLQTLHEETNITKAKWPKFEDILLDIGKRYDWKNDRWIKVKNKNIYQNTRSEINDIDETIDHQKHNFKYRVVKLNRTKSKRNIVIAVTAVR